MRSNYKRLEKYIRVVDERNKEDKQINLLGVSTQKFFIPSIANTVGTNFKRYKIVKRNQFTYVPDTSRRGDKIGIALQQGYDEALVSQAYTVFEIIDHNELDPEYLMIWFRRPEFDRYARFKSHGSVREIFDWEEMCDIELPVPSIEKQHAIVKEYKTVVNRIKLNEVLNQKLEETAQTLYKHWFVDFEFPNENGKPYKSSGGKMIWNEELEQEIPEGWEVTPFTEVVILRGGGTPSTKNLEYWDGLISFYTPADISNNYYSINTIKKITELGLKKCSSRLYPVNTTFITARGATVGGIAMAGLPMAMNQTCYAINGQENNNYFAHQLTLRIVNKLKSEAIGATFKALVTKNFNEQMVIAPPIDIISSFDKKISPIYQSILIENNVNQKLNEFQELLLSKLSQTQEQASILKTH